MKLLVDGFKTACVHMRIDLGGGNVGMTEHHLNRAQICAPGEQVGGKGVAHGVRADFFADAPLDGQFPDDLPEAVTGHGLAPVADKEVRAGPVFQQGRSSAFQVILDFFSCCRVKGHHALLVALA